jgi:hypothetical protein
MFARMKSASAGPDWPRMSRLRAAIAARLRSISPVTMAASVSIEAGSLPGRDRRPQA